MAEIVSIATAIATIKTAIDVAKAIRLSDLTLDKAETKLKLAELYELLADAKMQMVETSDLFLEMKSQIANLEKSIEFKGRTKRIGDAYFEIDDSDVPFGDPYCPACLESGKPPIHLTVGYRCFNCPSCKLVLMENRIRIPQHMRFTS